jgi:hypothetical protein
MPIEPTRRFLVAAALLAAAWGARAAGHGKAGLEVLQPWSRPAAAGTSGVGYMTIANHGRADDALVGVESPVSPKIEMHSMSMAGGVMMMARQDRVAVPAGGRAIFGPGAYHLMLMRLARPLKPGDEAPAVLRFASGARIEVRFKVGDGIGPPMAGMDHR